LESITGLFKRKDTSHAVRYNRHHRVLTNRSVKILEFLYFYLIPEPALPKCASPTSSSTETPSSEGSGSDSSSSSAGLPPKIIRRTTEEKKGMVGKLLGGEKGVEGLVRDLQEFRPFGDIG
jgi:Cell division control protein 14, SIN component